MQNPSSQHRARWCAAELDYLARLVWAGVPPEQIANRLQRTVGAVSQKMRQLWRSQAPFCSNSQTRLHGAAAQSK